MTEFAYQKLDEMLGGTEQKSLKKTRLKVWAERSDNLIHIRLEKTRILCFFPDGTIVLDSGGWQTTTTKARMNDYLPAAWQIFQKNSQWYLRNRTISEDYIFVDGITILPDGSIKDAGIDQSELINEINRYAKAYAEAFFKRKIPPPSAGDCWDCSGSIEGTRHILSHLEENYFVPSILSRVHNEFASVTKWLIAAVWKWEGIDEDILENGCFLEIAREDIRKAVRKFCRTELGLPGRGNHPPV